MGREALAARPAVWPKVCPGPRARSPWEVQFSLSNAHRTQLRGSDGALFLRSPV